jgi:hypothetical protein
MTTEKFKEYMYKAKEKGLFLWPHRMHYMIYKNKEGMCFGEPLAEIRKQQELFKYIDDYKVIDNTEGVNK